MTLVQILRRIEDHHAAAAETIKAFEQAEGFKLEVTDANVGLHELHDLAEALARKIAV